MLIKIQTPLRNNEISNCQMERIVKQFMIGSKNISVNILNFHFVLMQ